MIPSIYLNLEDDVSKIVERVKKVKSEELVLVCPKRCFLFNDSINLRLLKKQTDLLQKKVHILTMDEKGKLYAKEAGFELKFLPKSSHSRGMSDIKFDKRQKPDSSGEEDGQPEKRHLISDTVKELQNIGKIFTRQPLVAAKEEEKKKQTKAAEVPKVTVRDNIFPLGVVEAGKQKSRTRNYKIAFSLLFLAILVAFSVFFIVLPKAEITIYPKKESLVRDMEITVGAAIAAADPSKLLLPAKQISETLEVENQFQSQGKKEVGNKAKGTVQIYNFTGSTLNLKADTTKLQIGGKAYYLSANAMQIKPTKYKNSSTKEVDLNSLGTPLEIVAEQGGESYNLPAETRLEITNQVFGSKPKQLYAKIVSAVSGGTSRFLSIIAESDISDSQTKLIAQAIEQINKELKPENLILTDKAYQTQVVNFTTDKSSGTESPSFKADLKITITGLAFNPEELKKLVLDRINLTLSTTKTLKAEADKQINFEVKDLNLANGLATLYIHFQGEAFRNIDLNNIADELKNKTTAQVNEILSSQDGIERIDVNLAPSWQKRLPWFSSKINVVVKQE